MIVFYFKKLMLKNKIRKKISRKKIKENVESSKLFKPVIWVIRSKMLYMEKL
jgi:hypothetical protein